MDQLKYTDRDIHRILDWFLSFMDESEWKKRKNTIEAKLESAHTPRLKKIEAEDLQLISIKEDGIGWYLYLAETALNEMYKYEHWAGSRILPFFKQLGQNFDQLMQIKGVEDRVDRMIKHVKGSPDSAIFELTTALLWKLNGWKHVEFIPETPSEKSPDILAYKKNDEWYIECKRLAKSSEYSSKEREKWRRMASYITETLIKNYNYLLDITFHVELNSLPDTFIQDELVGKLPLLVPPCHPISNEIWDVKVKRIDFHKIKKHLRKNYVKYPSEQLNELIVGEKRDTNYGFTSGLNAEIGRLGEGIGNNFYVNSIKDAYGIIWSCDSPDAIEAKARNIKWQLVEAIKQIPFSSRGAVHIGFETLDGPQVEKERYKKILDSIHAFIPKKDVRYIYCNLFQPYSTPDELWIMDETAYIFSNNIIKTSAPLKYPLLLEKKEGYKSSNSVHWLKEHP